LIKASVSVPDVGNGPIPETIVGQLGWGPQGIDPVSADGWTWTTAAAVATFKQPSDGDQGYQFAANALPDKIGSFDYVFRITSTGGRDWLYADLDGPFTGVPGHPGVMTVVASDDTTSPAVPQGLTVDSSSVIGVELSWQPVAGDPSLFGYEIGRALESGGPFEVLGLVTETAFRDNAVTEGTTYFYGARSVDTSWNRSEYSAAVETRPGPRPVTVVFNVTIPDPAGRASGQSVYVAGTLNLIDPALPEWDPAGVALTKVDDTHWTISLTAQEGTQVEYKYVLGTWDLVEKSADLEEISNRRLTAAYGNDGTQAIEDEVLNWRNVGACPN
jgi:hypothetical protein